MLVIIHGAGIPGEVWRSANSGTDRPQCSSTCNGLNSIPTVFLLYSYCIPTVFTNLVKSLQVEIGEPCARHVCCAQVAPSYLCRANLCTVLLCRFVAARHEKSDTIESALPFSAKRGYEML